MVLLLLIVENVVLLFKGLLLSGMIIPAAESAVVGCSSAESILEMTELKRSPSVAERLLVFCCSLSVWFELTADVILVKLEDESFDNCSRPSGNKKLFNNEPNSLTKKIVSLTVLGLGRN